MPKQFMVRILRDSDESDYADVVVDADDENLAKTIALGIVAREPEIWFDDPSPPRYTVDRSSDIEDVTGGDYASAK